MPTAPSETPRRNVAKDSGTQQAVSHVAQTYSTDFFFQLLTTLGCSAPTDWSGKTLPMLEATLPMGGG